jgi:hypothetical protein
VLGKDIFSRAQETPLGKRRCSSPTMPETSKDTEPSNTLPRAYNLSLRAAKRFKTVPSGTPIQHLKGEPSTLCLTRGSEIIGSVNLDH